MGSYRRPGLRQLAFQRVTEWVPPRWPDPAYPQQLHLDIRVSDTDQAEQELLALGATRVRDEREKGFRVFMILLVILSASSSAAPAQAEPASAHAAYSAPGGARRARLVAVPYATPDVVERSAVASGGRSYLPVGIATSTTGPSGLR